MECIKALTVRACKCTTYGHPNPFYSHPRDGLTCLLSLLQPMVYRLCWVAFRAPTAMQVTGVFGVVGATGPRSHKQRQSGATASSSSSINWRTGTRSEGGVMASPE